MKRFLAPNINARGRMVRAVYGGVMIAIGVLALNWSIVAGVVLLALGGLGLLEALRGWCVLRACGIKTRL